MMEQLVAGLPEVYQPIYSHPELSGQVSRSSADRLVHIARIHDALQHLLGRPLKVLDLGCAQGYFSFKLAERGAQVHGVDFLDKNIAVCNALAQENPSLTVSFETGRIEDSIAALVAEQYDLVLGLSVFHHIVHDKGVSAVKAMLDHAAVQCGALVVELALREEPLYWAAAQPEDPRSLLDGIAFAHELARHETHLAPIPRPLFVASNRYWLLEDQVERFDSWSSDSHALAQNTHQGSRRYFFSAKRVLKTYMFDHPRGECNKAEFERELKFLQLPPSTLNVPKMMLFGENDKLGWLVMERFSGRLLLDLLREGAPVDSRAVLLAVLKQLAVFEGAGLYHDDVRTWNVIVAEDGTPHLIDYGSIGSRAQDCVWPHNLFLSFLIFLREVVTGVVDDPDPLRTIAISPFGLPPPYRAWVTQLWRRPLEQWSFKLMHETLTELPVMEDGEPQMQPEEAWMGAMEEAVQVQKRVGNHLKNELASNHNQFEQLFSALTESHNRELALCHAALQRLDGQVKAAEGRALAAETRATEAESRVTEAESCANKALTKQVELQSQVDQLNGQAHLWWQRATQLKIERNALRSSWSWRITAPLRFIASLIIRPLSAVRFAANHVIHRTIEGAQRPLSWLMLAVLRRPQLAYRINQVLMRYPALHRQLQNIAVRSGLLAVGQANLAHAVKPNSFVPSTIQGSLLARAVVSLLKNKRLVSSVHAALKPFPKLHAKAIQRVTGLVSSVAQPIWSPASSKSIGVGLEQEPTQLLLDVTGLIQDDAGTGVQRLVRSLLVELIANPPNRLAVRPVCAALGEQGYRYAGERVRQLYGIGEEESGVVDLSRGDIFVALDLQHASVIQNQVFFQTVRSVGVRVFFVVYDLLPVRYPNYFSPAMEFLHREWLKVVACSDGALCISNTVAKDLRAWMDQNDLAAIGQVPIHHFALGSELPAVDSTASAVPDAPGILAMRRRRPAFLMVGTIEPRKGHALVLAVFEHLWRQGEDVDLIIVGKPGWMMDDLMSRFCCHPELGQHLHWLESANDDVLALAYRNCTCLIAASECEGYGLPLVEAARYGLPIIARDIDPFREIADGSAYFFNSTATPCDLADTIQTWLELHRNGESPRSDGIRQVTWSQSAQYLIECIDPVLEQYLFGGSDRRDGNTSVERVLSGIRRELSSYREGVQ